MSSKSIVHVIGTGTIGEPLIGLLAGLREPLGLEEITFHKQRARLEDRPKVASLLKRGAKLCVDDSATKEFQDLGMEPSFEAIEAIDRASIVIDCTPSGVGSRNKTKYYEKFLSNTAGFIAQGSEFGFGKPYARGINDSSLKHGEDRFIQVVSCNTHNLSSLIHTLALEDGGPENLVQGRFVCMRRANDISQDGSFVPSPVVGKHSDARFGTHHARDAWHLFNTMGYDLNLFSSAVKINTQYMHTIYFDIRLKNPSSEERLIELMTANDKISLTHKTSSNSVFSFGRDQGHYGRILNVAVVSLPTLRVNNGNEVVGYCFTPQDGNSLLSSVSAAIWLLDPDGYEDRIQCLKTFFIDEV